MKKIVLLIPVYNEEKNIINVLNNVKHFDILIIVNDGSSDSSEDLILEWMGKKNNVYYRKFKKNRGMAAALKKGFCFINHLLEIKKLTVDDMVVTIDSDGQHKPEFITKMVDYARDNEYDMVLANRDFSHYPYYKIVGNSILSTWATILSKYKWNDIESGLRCFKVGILSDILKYYTGYRYSNAQEIGIITALHGYRISNLFPIVFTMSIVVFLRVKLGLKSKMRRRG